MLETARAIDQALPEKLKDQGYRRVFFLAEASARIAKQIITLRKRRGLSQKQLAELAGTQQPAISRVERADYQNWSFNTLRNIADALDARIRVVLEASEDILAEYEIQKGDEIFKRTPHDYKHNVIQASALTHELQREQKSALAAFNEHTQNALSSGMSALFSTGKSHNTVLEHNQRQYRN